MPSFDEAYLEQELEKFHAIEPKRLSTEGCVNLIEWLLEGVHDDIKTLTRDVLQSPDNAEICREAYRMYVYLNSNAINIFTMGHGVEIAKRFAEEINLERVKEVIRIAGSKKQHDRIQT